MNLKKIDSKKINKSHLMQTKSIEEALGAKTEDFLEIYLAHQHGEAFVVIKKAV